jgi:lysine-specific demethylase 8
MDVLKDVLAKSKSIPETTNFDSKQFKKNHLQKGLPVVLKGYGNQWPAKSKWTLDFLSGLESNHHVSLEIGANNQNETNFVKQNLSTYINSIKAGEFNTEKEPAYLTLFNIFERYPELKQDIDLSIFTKFTQKNDVFAWIGPKGTVTGFHYDSLNNILAQVMGKKLVVLVAPKFNKGMYVSEKFEYGAISSQVDVNNYHQDKHPKFNDVEFLSVVLEPGDALFIPKKWWHYVRSLETSISISNFGALLNDIWITDPFERIQFGLHCRGYYKKGNCTCHKVVDGRVVSKFA